MLISRHAGYPLEAMLMRCKLACTSIHEGRLAVSRHVDCARHSPVGPAYASPASARRMLRAVHARSTRREDWSEGAQHASTCVLQVAGAATLMFWAGNVVRRSTACDAAAEQRHHARALHNNRGVQCAGAVCEGAPDRWPGLRLVFLRFIRHVAVFGPLLVLYLPFRLAGERANNLWWKWALSAVGSSGPALVKLCQWAATRSDMFPAELCGRLSRMHSQARTHPLAHSERALHELLSGAEYDLICIDAEPVGSGCIAQVHRAVISRRLPHRDIEAAPAAGDAGSAVLSGSAGHVGGQEVAIKIVHPGVQNAARADVEVLRFVTRVVEFVPALRYLSLRESVEEFARCCVYVCMRTCVRFGCVAWVLRLATVPRRHARART